MFDLKSRILVVDDMFAMRKMVIKICKELGFTDFQEAGDGNAAWDVLEASNPPIQLVISDWNMPNLSGLDLLKKLRASPKYKPLPFVMVTAESEQGQVVMAIQAGVTNYIVKPFTAETMKEKLKAAHAKIAKQ